MKNLSGYFVVAGDQGPGAGRTWETLEQAELYKKSLLVVYPTSTQNIYRLVLVKEETK